MRRRADRRAIAEVEADHRLHLLDRARRLHVQLHDEVAAGLQRPREVRPDQRRHLARRPAEEVPVGILGGARHQAVVAGQGIGVVQRARRRASGRRGCWRDARRAGCPGGTRSRARRRASTPESESRRCGTSRSGSAGSDERLGERDDEVRACRAASRRGTAGARAFRPDCPRACRRRPRPRASSCSASVSGRCPSKCPIAGSTFHGGMNRLRVTCSDLGGALPDLVVGRQAEGPGPARSMAGRARFEDDGGDVAREDRCRLRRCGRALRRVGLAVLGRRS